MAGTVGVLNSAYLNHSHPRPLQRAARGLRARVCVRQVRLKHALPPAILHQITRCNFICGRCCSSTRCRCRRSSRTSTTSSRCARRSSSRCARLKVRTARGARRTEPSGGSRAAAATATGALQLPGRGSHRASCAGLCGPASGGSRRRQLRLPGGPSGAGSLRGESNVCERSCRS